MERIGETKKNEGLPDPALRVRAPRAALLGESGPRVDARHGVRPGRRRLLARVPDLEGRTAVQVSASHRPALRLAFLTARRRRAAAWILIAEFLLFCALLRALERLRVLRKSLWVRDLERLVTS